MSLDEQGVVVVIVDSAVRRALGNSPYNQRRWECAQAAAALGVPALRDLASDDLEGMREQHSVFGDNLRESGAAKSLEVAFSHPIKLIANALGVPPKIMLDMAKERGVATAALVGAKQHAIRQVEAGVEVRFLEHSSPREIYVTGMLDVNGTEGAPVTFTSNAAAPQWDDWGGLLRTEDYHDIGEQVRKAALNNDGGYFAILEGGYNHQVLGDNVLALIQGMSGN